MALRVLGVTQNMRSYMRGVDLIKVNNKNTIIFLLTLQYIKLRNCVCCKLSTRNLHVA